MDVMVKGINSKVNSIYALISGQEGLKSEIADSAESEGGYGCRADVLDELQVIHEKPTALEQIAGIVVADVAGTGQPVVTHRLMTQGNYIDIKASSK